MKRINLFFLSLLACLLVGTNAWGDNLQLTWNVNYFFWKSGTDTPQGIQNIYSTITGDAANTSNDNVRVRYEKIRFTTSGNQTVIITYKGGSHKLNSIGVDILGSDKAVKASDYHWGTEGGSHSNNTYTLQNVTAGEYILRTYVTNKESITANGTITITNAERVDLSGSFMKIQNSSNSNYANPHTTATLGADDIQQVEKTSTWSDDYVVTLTYNASKDAYTIQDKYNNYYIYTGSNDNGDKVRIKGSGATDDQKYWKIIPDSKKNEGYFIIPNRVTLGDGNQTNGNNPPSWNFSANYNKTGANTALGTWSASDGNSGWFISKALFTIEYTLTDIAGNVYQGSFVGKQGDHPTFTGVNTITYENEQWGTNGGNLTLTATIKFPFNVSKVGGKTSILNLASFNSNSFYWFAEYDGDNTYVKVIKDQAMPDPSASNINDFRWAIYPSLNNGVFTFQIKNIGAGKYIQTVSDGNHNKGTIQLTDSPTSFEFGTYDNKSNTWKYTNASSTAYYLSLNSSSTSEQYLGSHTTGHNGTVTMITDVIDYSITYKYVYAGTKYSATISQQIKADETIEHASSYIDGVRGGLLLTREISTDDGSSWTTLADNAIPSADCLVRYTYNDDNNFVIVPTTITGEGSGKAFAANTKFYFMSVPDKYVYLTSEGEDANKTYYLTGNATTKTPHDEYLYAFTGDPYHGFTVYNKARGAQYAFYDNSPSTDDADAGRVISFTDVPVGTWLLGPSTYNTSGYYWMKEQHSGVADKAYINRRNKDAVSTNPMILSFWFHNDAKGGSNSAVKFEAVDITEYETALSNAISATNNLVRGTRVGDFNATKLTAAVDKAQGVLDKENHTAAELYDANITLKAEVEAARVMPEEGHYYMIVSEYAGFMTSQGVEKSFYDDNLTLKWKTLDASQYGSYWYIYPNTNGTGYIIKNYGTNNFLNSHTTLSAGTETPWYFRLEAEATNSTEAVFSMTTEASLPDENKYIHLNGHNNGAGVEGNLILWGHSAGVSRWIIRQIADPELATKKAALQNRVDHLNNCAKHWGSNPGQYVKPDNFDTAVPAAQEVLDDETITKSTAYTTALTTLNEAIGTSDPLTPNPVVAGKYFIINGKTEFAKGKAMSALLSNNTSPGWNSYDSENPTPEHFWTLTATEGGFKMYNAWTNKYMVSDTQMSSNEADAKVVTFTYMDEEQFGIRVNGGNMLHALNHGSAESGALTTYNSSSVNDPSTWYVVCATAENEKTAAVTKFNTLKGCTKINATTASDVTIVTPTSFGTYTPADFDAAIEAVKNVNTETSTVTELGTVYSTQKQTITAYKDILDGETSKTIAKIDYTFGAEYGTIMLPCETRIPENITVHSCDGFNNKSLVLEDVTGNISKNTPYILHGTKDAKFQFIGFDYSSASETKREKAGKLYGTLETMTAAVAKTVAGTQDCNAYVLRIQGGKLGFYQLDPNTTYTTLSIGANRAFLLVDKKQSLTKAFYFDDDDPTAIEEVEAAFDSNTIIYNLGGQKLNKLQKGINIVNGKKVLY